MLLTRRVKPRFGGVILCLLKNEPASSFSLLKVKSLSDVAVAKASVNSAINNRLNLTRN